MPVTASPGRRRGFTFVEIVIVAAIVLCLLATVLRVVSATLRGSRRGYETLSVLQEEAKFLAVLKHDLRTMIMGTPASLTPAILDHPTGGGNATIIFYKVEDIDQDGRPLVSTVQYRCDDERTIEAFGGRPAMKVYTIYRSSRSGAEVRSYMRDMVTRLDLTWLDVRQNELRDEDSLKAHKIRIRLDTRAGELLQVQVNLYSPYLVSLDPASPKAVWFNNYLTRPFVPAPILLTYDRDPIPDTEYREIPGARGIAIDEP